MARLIVISGPSGAGKGTVIKGATAQVAGVKLSVSATTRPRRPEEQEGREYAFLTREEFQRRVESGWFLEWAEYAGNLYGTPLWTLEEDLSRGFDVILEIELQGADQVLRMRCDAVMIYIMPPSLEELERRLRGRDTETEEEILSRLARAREEIAIVQAKQRQGLPPMHYAIVNDSQARASAELVEIIELARKTDEQADSR